MKLTPRKPINTNDSIGRGMDLALVTLAFLGIGYALDRILGTRPWCMVGFVLVAFAGQFVKMYYEYTAKMAALEARRADGQHRPVAGG